jgi:hypothetical protein
MSEHEQGVEAAEPPEEEQEREYAVTLRVVGRIHLFTMAASQEEAEDWAENCDADPAKIDIADVEILSVEVNE